MDQAFGHRLGIRVVADLPDFRHIFQRGNKALARRSIVDSRHARALVSLGVHHRDDLRQRQILRIEHHQRVWQVVGHHHPFAVARHGGIARVEAGAGFRHDLQVPQIVFGHPAVARGEVDEAAVRRIFRAAVQRVAAGEAVDAFELVAIKHRDMVIAGFDDDEQVHRVGTFQRSGRLVWQIQGCGIDHLRRLDLGLAPDRCRHNLGVDEIGQRLYFLSFQLVAKRRHLRRRAAVTDDLEGFRLAQAFEIFRQQRRTDTAEAVFTVTGQAVFLVQRLCVDAICRFGKRGHAGQEYCQIGSRNPDTPVHESLLLMRT
jgi:hypothetical protein